MEFRAQNPYVNMRLQMSHEGEYKLPRVGISATRYQIGGVRYEKYSVRCDVEGCWFMGGSLPTEEAAQKYLDDHKADGRNFTRPCPAPPRRESLPSGLRHIEKLWRELDDVCEALATAQAYRGMTLEQCRGYAKGLSFSIVMMEPVHFEDIESVSRHARDRRRMRLGEIPFVPTPTNLGHDAKTVDVQGLHVAEKQSPKRPEVPENIRNAIKLGLDSGMFNEADMAETYKLPIEVVRAIKG